MKIDAVFSGGGVKAYALIGVLESLESHNFSLNRVAGSSAGAIMAALIAAGYHTDEIETIIQDLDVKTLLDPPKWTTFIPFTKWMSLYFQMGLYKGDKLECWIRSLLERKGVLTFQDLPKDRLKIVVSDISLGKLVVLPDDFERIYGIKADYFPVAKAVRMSAGYPYFFMPKKLPGKYKRKSLMVDGGLLSNFPLWVFDSKDDIHTRPVLGVKLNGMPEEAKSRKINNALEMFHALFSTMMQAHDTRYVSTTEKNNIIFIPVTHVETTNFNINELTKEQLIETGKKKTDEFLKFWPN